MTSREWPNQLLKIRAAAQGRRRCNRLGPFDCCCGWLLDVSSRLQWRKCEPVDRYWAVLGDGGDVRGGRVTFVTCEPVHGPLGVVEVHQPVASHLGDN
eukprot:CAMPEP_0119317700 /NCGR_PEP_ID=MMETSP1333-20130426/43947_1 /TAXON_ID=418940 /ORGANISM="Scyphosphaera apsteinii, Strain RCC1455" /LENGTH=97 /DNA_ID=CAMNT_0007323711 /DNA_START=367 /DNA_END=661 /DNA_ORIENTATION=+